MTFPTVPKEHDGFGFSVVVYRRGEIEEASKFRAVFFDRNALIEETHHQIARALGSNVSGDYIEAVVRGLFDHGVYEIEEGVLIQWVRISVPRQGSMPPMAYAPACWARYIVTGIGDTRDAFAPSTLSAEQEKVACDRWRSRLRASGWDPFDVFGSPFVGEVSDDFYGDANAMVEARRMDRRQVSLILIQYRLRRFTTPS